MFSENLLHYVTTMVCIAVKGVPVIGVIYQPFNKELGKRAFVLILCNQVCHSLIEHLVLVHSILARRILTKSTVRMKFVSAMNSCLLYNHSVELMQIILTLASCGLLFTWNCFMTIHLVWIQMSQMLIIGGSELACMDLRLVPVISSTNHHHTALP